MKRFPMIMVLWAALLVNMAFGNAWGADPTPTPTVVPDLSLSVDTAYVNISTPTKYSLTTGAVENESETGSYAVKIRITGGTAHQHWKLYVRAADDIFSPGVHDKECANLLWKFDREGSNAYRPLRTSKHLMASGAGGQTITEFIDLRMLVGWSDAPANYNLRLNFILAVE